MSEPGYIDKIYKGMIDNYNRNGEKFMYNGHPIINMNNKQINNEIYLINNEHRFDPRIRGWLEIFNDILNKRRFNKLNKIISNIQI